MMLSATRTLFTLADSTTHGGCRTATGVFVLALLCGGSGCVVNTSARSHRVAEVEPPASPPAAVRPPASPDRDEPSSAVLTVAGELPGFLPPRIEGLEAGETFADAVHTESLETLVARAETFNPRLRQLQQETAAAWAKVRYVDKLPDPVVGANVAIRPVEMADGPMRADLAVMQMIPWLERLDAQVQEAVYEAMVIQQEYTSERLRIAADVRIAWARLYVLGKQIETTQASQQLLETLTEVATARVATGEATQGDVLLATLELSRLREQMVTLEQQVVSTTAELNRRLGRAADSPVSIPDELLVDFPGWSHDAVLETARQRQPEIAAAQLRTCATRWGIEVARLQQRPDVTLNAMMNVMGHRSTSPMPPGDMPWSLGAQVSVPLWHTQYRAMRDEATWKHCASQAAVEDVIRMYDSLLRDLLAQASSADEIATLYRETIIPQARQTLESDQRAFAENVVEFDRVIQDFRNLLVLELAYHQSLGQLAIAIARIEQAAGSRLIP